VTPRLAPDDVHVWLASLDAPPFAPAAVTALHASLSPDERDRASRFHFERHRIRFATARGLLRAILSAYLETPPADIRFEYGPHGKPAVANPAGICFNLSHSENWVVYAVSRVDVGVDIQAVDDARDYLPVAERFFSSREVAALTSLGRADVPRAFAACWAKKEAYIKARGGGLTMGLSSFEVSLEVSGAGWTRVGGKDATGWHVRALPSAASYEGAVAARDTARVVRCCDWSSIRARASDSL
jgi:4'-phosphopantetheinyl transferase